DGQHGRRDPQDPRRLRSARADSVRRVLVLATWVAFSATVHLGDASDWLASPAGTVFCRRVRDGEPTEEQARAYITKLLTAMSKAGGSDLFVSVDFPPAMKFQGALQPLTNQKLTGEVTRDLANSLMN